MKKKLFKFFEIGKIDRGLFRIWIVLSIIFIIYIILDTLSSKNNEISNYSSAMETVRKPSVYCKPQFKHDLITTTTVINNNEILLPKYWKRSENNEVIYGHENIYEKTFGVLFENPKTFSSQSDCKNYYKKIKDEAFNKMFVLLLSVISIPFYILIIYLFLKKIFLWIKRGFI
tara:strand:- start:44 stop:562 length:519 start_codon:yes stop_codon:yes gene_type:complete